MNAFSAMHPIMDCTDLTTDDEDDVVEIRRNDFKTEDVLLHEQRISELIESLPLSSKLRKLVDLCGVPLVVKDIPETYNGNLSFELPPSQLFAMDGMQRSFDCHNWVRYSTTSIQGFAGVVRISNCGGGFVCTSSSCNYFLSFGERNQKHFTGRLSRQCSAGTLSANCGTFKCKYCATFPHCVVECQARIYYCLPHDVRYTRLAIHIGTHEHEYGCGQSSNTVSNAENLIGEKYALKNIKSPGKVCHEMAKDLIAEHLLGSGDLETITEQKLNDLLATLEPTTNSRRLKRWIISARKELQPVDFSQDITSFMYLKEHCKYDFFQGSLFPGQLHDKQDRCYVFKMSTTGPASGVDLVRRMQPNGDLEKAWCCFDHVYRVREWVSMACHVYDNRIQAMQTIAICEMKEQDVQAQVLFWELLNRVMASHWDKEITFRGFMADEAQANWLAVRTVYGGDPTVPLQGKERSCYFHFMDNVRKNTEKYIKVDSREEHIALCVQWRNARCKADADDIFNKIIAWWKIGHAYENSHKELESWISWWKNRMHRWGKFVCEMLDEVDEAFMPSTNLAEVVHSVWKRVDSQSTKVTLYEAAVGDMANSILQSAREKSFLAGKFIGRGPNLQDLMSRVRAGRRASIVGASFSESINNFVETIDLTSECISGNTDSHTIRRKRAVGEWNNEKDTVSHRPDVEYIAIQRRKSCPPTFTSGSAATTLKGVSNDRQDEDLQNYQTVIERQVNGSWWAIRRLNPSSKHKCQGMKAEGRGRCNKIISTTVAPSFYGRRKYSKGECNQYMWFCATDIRCTWIVNANIVNAPSRVKELWMVQKDTMLTQDELNLLNSGGYLVETKNQKDIDSSSNLEDNMTNTPTLGPNVSTQTVGNENCRNHMRRRSCLSKNAKDRVARALLMNASVKEITRIPKEHKELFVIESFDSVATGMTYNVMLSKEPSCTCMDFQKSIASRKYITCKHMYYVYLRLKGLDVNENMFIHQPVLSEHELFYVLSKS